VSLQVKRHFVTLDGRWGVRQIHYRRVGRGPLLLMLHQSPQSSLELVPLMEQWGAHFTIVAPDSPGYGLSDPLGVDEAGLSDFAAATIEFADAIGAGKFGIYGFHTGGMIGIAVAHRYPERVAGFACNGVAVPTNEELEEILAVYMPRFEPRWDGGHLAWLWGRTREQTIFFPWHKRLLAARMDFPMPAPEHQQSGVREFLRAADHYHVAYRAAFTFHAERVVPQLTVPGLITATARDPLQAHLSRLAEVPDCVRVVESATPAEASERCLAHVTAHAGDELPGVPATKRVPNRLWRQLVETEAGVVSIRRGGQGPATPVVILHGAGGSSTTVAFLAQGLVATRAVICIDLPGHGETDCDPVPAGPTIDACAELVIAVLDELDLPVVDVVGVDGGACVALEVAGCHPDRAGRLALVHPPELSPGQIREFREHGMPSLAPDWFGGHLLHCWHMVRDSRLYFPWFRRDQAGIVWQEPDLDDRRIQLEVTEYLKADGAWQKMLQNQLDYPLQDKLVVHRDKITVYASPKNPWYPVTRNTAAHLSLPFCDLDGDPDDWGTIMASGFSA